MTKFLTLAAALLMTAGTAIAASDSAMSSGTVTKIDAKWNKITVDHGPLENLDMPAMKMVFVLADPAMLEGLTYYHRLRYRLLPYIYTLAAEAHFDAGTIMRPLVMDFKADRATWEIDDEYLFGPAMLVAPVTEFEAARTVLAAPASL